MKESYLKYTGKGLSDPLSSFTVIKEKDKFILTHSSRNENVYLKQYNIEEGYKLAVCSEVDDFCMDVKLVDIESLIEVL
jgi:4'-phosphopantetheinyl transferase